MRRLSDKHCAIQRVASDALDDAEQHVRGERNKRDEGAVPLLATQQGKRLGRVVLVVVMVVMVRHAGSAAVGLVRRRRRCGHR